MSEVIDGNEIDDIIDEGGQEQVEEKPIVETPQTDEVKIALAELAGSMKTLSESQKPVEKVPTQEEIDKLWGIYNPEAEDPEFFAKFMRLPVDMDAVERKQVLDQFKGLFGKMQKGLVTQAVTGALNMTRAQHQEFYDKEFKPVSEYAAELRREKTRESFYKSYPALADAKFEKVVAASATALNGKDFKNNKDYFKALAESAVGLIQAVLPEFKLDSSEKQDKTETTPRLPRTRVGSTGGSGGGAAGQGDGKTNGGDIDSLE